MRTGPRRQAGATDRREAAGGGDVRDREDAGNDLGVDTCSRRFVAEAEEAVGREEELGDRPVGTGIDLPLEVLEVEDAVAGVRVDLGIGGDRDVERGNRPQAGDQFARIAITLRMRLVFRSGPLESTRIASTEWMLRV